EVRRRLREGLGEPRRRCGDGTGARMSASGLAAPLRPSELAGDADALDEVAARLRERVLDMCAGPEGGHLGSALSLVELLVALYFAVLRVDPARPEDPERDV